MAERELAIVLRARDLASKSVRGLKKEIGTLGKTGTRAMNGLSTAIRNVGLAAAVGLTGAIALGARSLGHLERVTNQTNAVLESTAGASGQTTKSIRDQAEALEQLTTADDKNIQEAQNLLLTFTKIGGTTFPKATEAAINMAIAMAKGDVANADFKGSALQVGKALNDPIKGMSALSKAGVSFTKEQKEQVKALVKAGKVHEAQALILRELEVEFGNAGKAAGTGFEADMRRVEDAGEDASNALARGVMPILKRFATFLSTKLADPAVLKALDELGAGLGNAAGQALDFLEKLDFKAIGTTLGIAADAAGTLVGWFMDMPPWVQAAVISGWGLNKITGGLLTDVLGGVVKGVLGMTAGVVHLNAGTVIGAGGLGSAGIPSGAIPGWDPKAGAGGGIKGLVSGLPMIGIGIIAAEAAQAIGHAVLDNVKPVLRDAGVPTSPVEDAGIAGGGFLTDLLTGHPLDALGRLPDIAGSLADLVKLVDADKVVEDRSYDAIEKLRTGAEARDRQMDGNAARRASATTAASLSAGRMAAAAINAKDLSVAVDVKLNTAVSISTRYVAGAIVKQEIRRSSSGSILRDHL